MALANDYNAPAHRVASLPQPTAWKSVPGLIRFTVWFAAIVFLIYNVVIPVVVIIGASTLFQYAAYMGA